MGDEYLWVYDVTFMKAPLFSPGRWFLVPLQQAQYGGKDVVKTAAMQRHAAAELSFHD